jgi:glutaminase
MTKSQVKRLNALMQTCGFYDESGGLLIKWDYQVRVG